MFRRRDSEPIDEVRRDERTMERRDEPMPADREVYRERVDATDGGVVHERRVDRGAGDDYVGERTPVRERDVDRVPVDRDVDTAYGSDSVTERHSAFYDSIPARVNSVLFALLLALEGLLALRFVLIAFGASRSSGFVRFIYDVSHPFVRPFSSAFTDRTWDNGIIELNTLLAMGVYLIAFVLVAVLVNALLPRGDTQATRIRRSRVSHT